MISEDRLGARPIPDQITFDRRARNAPTCSEDEELGSKGKVSARRSKAGSGAVSIYRKRAGPGGTPGAELQQPLGCTEVCGTRSNPSFARRQACRHTRRRGEAWRQQSRQCTGGRAAGCFRRLASPIGISCQAADSQPIDGASNGSSPMAQVRPASALSAHSRAAHAYVRAARAALGTHAVAERRTCATDLEASVREARFRDFWPSPVSERNCRAHWIWRPETSASCAVCRSPLPVEERPSRRLNRSSRTEAQSTLSGRIAREVRGPRRRRSKVRSNGRSSSRKRRPRELSRCRPAFRRRRGTCPPVTAIRRADKCFAHQWLADQRCVERGAEWCARVRIWSPSCRGTATFAPARVRRGRGSRRGAGESRTDQARAKRCSNRRDADGRDTESPQGARRRHHRVRQVLNPSSKPKGLLLSMPKGACRGSGGPEGVASHSEASAFSGDKYLGSERAVRTTCRRRHGPCPFAAGRAVGFYVRGELHPQEWGVPHHHDEPADGPS